MNINILKFYLEKISLSYTSLNYQKINLFFFRNKLYKYNINFIINDNINFPEKQILINSVSAEKTINFNDINLKNNFQSIININKSILLVTYV